MTYLFRGNPLSPHRLFIPICSKGSFLCTFPKTGQHIPRPLMDQLWITGCIRENKDAEGYYIIVVIIVIMVIIDILHGWLEWALREEKRRMIKRN